MGDHLLDQTELEGFLGGNHLARQAQVFGGGLPHQPRKALGSPVTGNHPQIHLRLAEAGLFGSDQNVPSHRQLASASQGVAVDRHDDRFAHLLNPRKELLSADRQALPFRSGGNPAQLSDIGSGHKGLVPGPGDDQGADLFVGLHPLDGLFELRQGLPVQGVQHFGTLNGDLSPTVPLLKRDVFPLHRTHHLSVS